MENEVRRDSEMFSLDYACCSRKFYYSSVCSSCSRYGVIYDVRNVSIVLDFYVKNMR